jgi:lipooligosaccharide transport system permease protein
MQFRRLWRGSLASTVLFPVLYLLAMGIGVGHLVSTHSGLVQGQTYLHYIAPSLLATTAMQLAEGESLWPVLAAVKWIRTYHAAVATPLEARDIFFGKLSWLATRGFFTGVIYTAAIGAFGALTSWWAITLPFLCALVTMSFAAPIAAYAAGAKNDATFPSIYRFAIVPMFLFSATFYPLSAYPGYLRPVVQLMPLYHAVALSRSAAFGTGSVVATSAHLAVLVAMAVVGWVWGVKRLTARLGS